eukprot:scaffold128_cov328-Pavlova_lutheri.AAC.23
MHDLMVSPLRKRRRRSRRRQVVWHPGEAFAAQVYHSCSVSNWLRGASAHSSGINSLVLDCASARFPLVPSSSSRRGSCWWNSLVVSELEDAVVLVLFVAVLVLS